MGCLLKLGPWSPQKTWPSLDAPNQTIPAAVLLRSGGAGGELRASALFPPFSSAPQLSRLHICFVFTLCDRINDGRLASVPDSDRRQPRRRSPIDALPRPDPPQAVHRHTTTHRKKEQEEVDVGNGGAATSKMQKISLPKPSFHMRSSDFDAKDYRMNCFPAVERRVFCLDKLGRGVLLEADTQRILMLPHLHKPKLDPISLYIPCDDDLYDLHDGGGGGGGSLFVMDRVTNPAELDLEAAAAGCQSFEAIVYRKTHSNFQPKSWDCDILPPPPPYAGHGGCLEIASHAVVGGGRQICVSVAGAGAGTYCMDTASYAWREVGNWTLPFQGKIEYVPELELWFGFSAEEKVLAAADLSAMDSGESSSSQPPQLVDCWKELELEPPRGWQQIRDPQLVCLGSGRFCIARFLRTAGSSNGGGFENESSGQQDVTVLTGVEVATAYDFGYQVYLELVRHRSRCYMSSCGEDTITAVF
ncbi:unnamed protein product [Urochloa humidicola]